MDLVVIATLILRIIVALVTGRKESVQKHAQAIVDHLSGERDKAKAQAAQAEVELAKAKADADKKVFDIKRSQRGGSDW